jgi:hypothetical protein
VRDREERWIGMHHAANWRMVDWVEPAIVGRFAARTAMAMLLVFVVALMFALDIAFLWK